MLGVTLLAQVADDVVGLDIDIHADNEHQEPCDKSRVSQPVGGIIVIGRDVENSATLHEGI